MAAITFGTQYDPNRRFRSAIGDVVSTYPPGTVLAQEGGACLFVIGLNGVGKGFRDEAQFRAFYTDADIVRLTKAQMITQLGPEGIDPRDGLGNGIFGSAVTITDAELGDLYNIRHTQTGQTTTSELTGGGTTTPGLTSGGTTTSLFGLSKSKLVLGITATIVAITIGVLIWKKGKK
jgi:hypothetical protein